MEKVQSQDVRHETAGPAGMRGSRILVVQDRTSERDTLRGTLCAADYHVIEAACGKDAFRVLHASGADLVILGTGTSVDTAQFCRRVRADRRTELVPIIVLNGKHTVADHVTALAAGADDFLSPPIHPQILYSRINSLLRHKLATDRLDDAESILFALAQAVEQRDQGTAGHCERLAFASLAIGLALGLSRPELQSLYRGGFLHDIGKVALPDSILLKPGPLTPEEWSAMKTHPVRGEEICRTLKSLDPVLPIIRAHHEKWDGTGYPDGLSGRGIPLLARILQLADIYDALTSARPYKGAMEPEQALEIMQQETERGWRDPELMSTFLRLHRETFSRAAEFAQDMQPGAIDQSLANLRQAVLGAQAN